jgi:TPR repeat protein
MDKKPTFRIALLILIMAPFSALAATTFDVESYNTSFDNGSRALVSKNYEKAYEQLIKASKLGHKNAQYSVALMYMEGKGTKQDYAQAYLWLNVAAEAKDKKWRKMRNKIRKALSSEQQVALQPHVDTYIEKYGAKAQEISCSKLERLGSHAKQMECIKKSDSNLLPIHSRILNPKGSKAGGN